MEPAAQTLDEPFADEENADIPYETKTPGENDDED